jgi:hypothetical protein
MGFWDFPTHFMNEETYIIDHVSTQVTVLASKEVANNASILS